MMWRSGKSYSCDEKTKKFCIHFAIEIFSSMFLGRSLFFFPWGSNFRQTGHYLIHFTFIESKVSTCTLKEFDKPKELEIYFLDWFCEFKTLSNYRMVFLRCQLDINSSLVMIFMLPSEQEMSTGVYASTRDWLWKSWNATFTKTKQLKSLWLLIFPWIKNGTEEILNICWIKKCLEPR